MYASGILAQVEEWGEMYIRVKTPTREGQMKLTWVAYIPGFFTSVVGLSRSRSLGIHFDSGRDCLYQKKASNVVYGGTERPIRTGWEDDRDPGESDQN